MYTFTYDSQGSNSYLVYQLKDTDRIDSLSLGMVTHNQIEGLLPMIYQQQDENQYLKYNISSRLSLRQFYFDTVNRKQLLGVVSGITNTLLRAEEYMIDPDSLLLNTDYIFVDVSSCTPYMVCLPLMEPASGIATNGRPADINEKMSAFLKDVIFHTQFDQSEDLGYVAQIISFVNRPQPFSLPDFKVFLQQFAGGPLAREHTSPPFSSAGIQYGGATQTASPPVGTPQPTVPPYPGASQVSAPQAGARQASVPPHGQVPPAPPYVATPPGHAGQRPPQPPSRDAAGTSAPFVPPVPPVQTKSSRKKKEKTPAPVGEQRGAAPASGEKMSFMYLMTHYSKENKAIYDAQRQQQSFAPQKPTSPGSPQAPFAIPGVKESVPGSAQPFQQAPPKAVVPPQPPAPAGRPMPPPAPQPQMIKQEHTYQPTPVQAPPMPPTAEQPYGGASQSVSFGDTTSLSGGYSSDTVVLDAAGAKAKEHRALSPCLIRKSNQERISLNKPVFRIGKEKSFVDYFIGDNTAISRSHAHIVTRDGQFFVVDTNSTNHTFVNGQMIPPNHETVLNDGDVLTLANESFEFHLR